MKFLGLTSLEIDILKLVNGSPGNQTYGHFGFFCGSLHGFKLPEPVFRRYFLKCCERGMIKWQNEEQRFQHFKARYFEITARGRNFIRDLQIHFGGDYSFYKYFTGNPSELDKHMKHRVKFEAKDSRLDAGRRRSVAAASRRSISQEHAREEAMLAARMGMRQSSSGIWY